MAEKQKKPKLGAGHVAAMGRAGAKELAQALVALPGSTIRPVEEIGLAGNPTPQEVTRRKGAYDRMLRKYDSRRTERQPERQMER
jgi:hypothetical protein